MTRFLTSFLLVMTIPPAMAAGQIRSQISRLQGQGARDCVVCHLEWAEPFKLPDAHPLIQRPERMIAGEEDVCLGCHDGSVADDRRSVWLEHGHQTGITPPSDMTVPRELPLQDGKVACRTCHSAHSGREPMTIATAIFLRMPNDKGQLCMSCHSEFAKGPEGGFHPIGRLPWELPEDLLEAGAEAGEEHRDMACQACHTPHGSREDHLLVMAARSSQLCLTCHEKIHPEAWSPDSLAEHHPVNVRLEDPSYARAIREMGGRADENRLICLSCHRMHEGHGQNHLLRARVNESQLCLNCHSRQAGLLETPHHLGTTAPRERNLVGQTVAEAGPCSACHGVHHAARKTAPTQHDLSGECITCHKDGECAADASFTSHDHPARVSTDALPSELELKVSQLPGQRDRRWVGCQTCHDPHRNDHGQFLRAHPDDLCRACHQEQAEGLAGAHVFTGVPDARNAKGHSPEQAGTCGFCHAVHDATGPAMWAASRDKPETPAELCLNCHVSTCSTTHLNASATRHPLDDSACSTCHTVHGDSTEHPRLLRSHGEGDPRGEQWCLDCHKSQHSLTASMHSHAAMQRSGFEADADYCGACHAVHADPGSGIVGMNAAPPGDKRYPPDMRLCLGCHRENGPAQAVRIVQHPPMPMRNGVEPDHDSFMPLAGDTSRLGSEGNVTCQTCHLPHGRSPGRGFPELDPRATTPERLEALKPMLRPYVVPNLCSNCHGMEGLVRFLYWHEPAKRMSRWQP